LLKTKQLARGQFGETLSAFLQTANEDESYRLLERFVDEHARPLIRKIVGSELRGRYFLQDAEDIAAEVVIQLVKKLLDLRSGPVPKIAGDFHGYVAVLTYNACNAYLRRKYPDRSRLKDKLRHLLADRRDFAIWKGYNHRTICGFASWQGQTRLASLRDLRDSIQAFGGADKLRQQALSHEPAELLTAIFNWVGRPIELDDLIDTVADLWNVGNQSSWASEVAVESLPDASESVALRVEFRAYLRRLWAEIRELPGQQRCALLLNLTDGRGDEMISSLVHTRVATIREIAEALDMNAEEFAAIWNDLPLSDKTISAMLGVGSQQVINMRKAARARLKRRMKGF
jgi:hypothetical protein